MNQETRERTLTTAQKVAHIAQADTKGFPIRKAAAFLILATGLFMIARHSGHHDEGEHVSWQAWALVALGGADLGLQMVGKLLERILEKWLGKK